MILYLRLAWRNFWRNRRRTVIVFLAIGLCMALMIFYDGLMAGFTQAIYANAVKVLGGNIQIHANGYSDQAEEKPLLALPDDRAVIEAAKEQPQVVLASRRINTSGMATSREGAFSVTIIGIEPEVEAPVSLLAQNITSGRFLLADDRDSIFIGKGLADAMGVAVGDRLTLVGRSQHEQMRTRTMTVIGIYDLGMGSIEKSMVYISLAEAQSLYEIDGCSEVAIVLKQLGQENVVIKALKPSLPGYEVDSWETNYPELWTAINSKSGVMNIFSVIILFIAGIGILNLLLMAVFERTREIGLLGALGMKPRQITMIFLLEGLFMGLMGAVLGVVLGLAINFALMQVGFDYSQFASLTEYTALINTRIYPTLGVEKLALRLVTVSVVTLLSSYYPARQASFNEPAESLHYV